LTLRFYLLVFYHYADISPKHMTHATLTSQEDAAAELDMSTFVIDRPEDVQSWTEVGSRLSRALGKAIEDGDVDGDSFDGDYTFHWQKGSADLPDDTVETSGAEDISTMKQSASVHSDLCLEEYSAESDVSTAVMSDDQEDSGDGHSMFGEDPPLTSRASNWVKVGFRLGDVFRQMMTEASDEEDSEHESIALKHQVAKRLFCTEDSLTWSKLEALNGVDDATDVCRYAFGPQPVTVD